MVEVKNDDYVDFTVKIPKSWFEFLKIFTATFNIDLEEILEDRLESLIRDIIDDPTLFYNNEKLKKELNIS